jgi:hypothetical protein
LKKPPQHGRLLRLDEIHEGLSGPANTAPQEATKKAEAGCLA